MRHAAKLLILLSLSCSTTLFAQGDSPRELVVNVGKSLVIDSPIDVVRVSVASPETVEAVGISPREIVLNGKKAGQTSVIVWQKDAGRLLFDVTVSSGVNTKLDTVRAELTRELAGRDVNVSVDGETVFLRGTVANLNEAERAMSIATALGKPVNLLKVNVPEIENQILLKVKFAEVNRVASQQLGVNLLSTGATGTVGRITTGQFSAPTVSATTASTNFTLSDALDIFLFRPDLDLGATIRLLQNKRLIEILAEPNVLAIDGREASFLAGGEFPYPIVQGGGVGVPVVTIQFREFGIRLGFKPQLTPRGTIRLQVEPEVSALDFANGLLFQGFNIPALTVRRVSTEIELEDRQSFVVAGLMDNRVTENMSKIPGLGDIPLLGKLFQSRLKDKSKSELLVLVTPEIVRPIPAGQPAPTVDFPSPFMAEGGSTASRTPGTEVTGPVSKKGDLSPIPVELLLREKQSVEEERQAAGSAAATGTGGGGGMTSSTIRK